ncbi:MAG: hypothetical protein JWQ94_84 [Tardiphaga sp.]|nr:hypothetical protein [Tardiphaga sp.]
MKRVSIPLREPLRGPHGNVDTVIIREPNVFECLEIGDPFVVGTSPSGAQLVVENYEAISAYTRRCLVEPADPALLHQGGVDLARAIKEAIIGFFLPGTGADAASDTSPTSLRSEASAVSATSGG